MNSPIAPTFSRRHRGGPGTRRHVTAMSWRERRLREMVEGEATAVGPAVAVPSVVAADARGGYDRAARDVVVAADERGGYQGGAGGAVADGPGAGTAQTADGGVVPPPSGPDPEPVGDLRGAVAQARAALLRVHRMACAEQVSCGGELAALSELVDTLDRGHAAALALVDRIESQGLAERRAGLPLASVLAM
ncbi:hypothetical protein ACERMF_17665, partial [Egicoccus sp. AB-alg6-2]